MFFLFFQNVKHFFDESRKTTLFTIGFFRKLTVSGKENRPHANRMGMAPSDPCRRVLRKGFHKKGAPPPRTGLFPAIVLLFQDDYLHPALVVDQGCEQPADQTDNQGAY